MARVLLILALSAAALAQSKSSSPQSTTKAPAQPTPAQNTGTPDAPAAQANIPPNQSIITIHGLCPSRPGEIAPAQNSASCTTSVSKQEFEALLAAVQATGRPIPPQAHRQVAQSYVDLLTFVHAAEKAGVEKDPQFQEAMKVQRMLVMSQFYRHRMEENAHNVPDSDVQAYYNQNLAKFQRVTLQRIFIPKRNPSSPAAPAADTDFAKNAAQIAADIRERAAKNEDMEKLQKEAYDKLGIQTAPPPVDQPAKTRNMVAATEVEEVFSLQPGAVSKVEDEAPAFIIYKLKSKETVPLEQVKNEISQVLFQQKMEADVKALTSAVHADLDDAYFGPAPSASRPGEFESMPPGAAPKPTPNPSGSPSGSTAPKSNPPK